MDNTELSERNAQDSYAREMEDVRKAAQVLSESENYDTAREQVEEENGTPLEVNTTKCVQILLATGGPARGYYIFLDTDNEPASGFYWFQDWYQPKRVFWLDSQDIRAVLDVYDVYTGE